MNVYRIETHDGFGPYVGEHLIPAMNDAHSKAWDTHPTGFWDDIRGFPDHRYAFASEALMRQWFDGWFDDLAANGFGVGVYWVDNDAVEHGESGRQLVFDPTQAERMSWTAL